MDVLKAGRVNHFFQDCTALVNSKEEINLLSEAQTTPFLPHNMINTEHTQALCQGQKGSTMMQLTSRG